MLFFWRGREDLNLRDAFYTSYSLSRGAPSASWVLPQVDGVYEKMAERVGFEPTETCASPVFKTGSLNHSDISPSAWEVLRLSNATLVYHSQDGFVNRKIEIITRKI